MSFAVGTMSKPISMATNGCLISVPSLFSTSRVSYSIPYKPIKLKLSCKNISKRQESLFRVFVVASQQEENDLVILEEQEEEEGQEIQENFNWAAPENDENEVDGFVEPPEGAKLYVGNLPYDVDSAKLAQLFETAGVVEISEVIYNRQTDQSRGFGFVTMSTEEEAEKAVEMFHGYDVNGRLLTVNIASPRGTRPERPPRTSEPGYKIYVGNLPWSVDDASLEKVFSKYGKVVSARLISDRETGRSRGFGFVVMSSESEMNDAISNLDGQSLDGRAMRVNAAAERQRRRSF